MHLTCKQIKYMLNRNKMKILQAYKFQLQPKAEQIQQMKQFTGCCRFVWNHGLATEKNNRIEYIGGRMCRVRARPERVELCDPKGL